MKYNTVIFDLDGTLLNTLEDLATSVNYALKEFNFPERTIDEVRNFVGNGVRILMEKAVPKGTPNDVTEQCLGVFKEHYKTHSAVKTKAYDGIIPLLEKLKVNNIKTAIVTNKMQEAALIISKNYFGELIDITIGQVDGLAQKPNPEGVFNAINKLGSDKEKCIYVGDSDVDCLTAHNAGLKVIGAAWGFRGYKALKEAGADYIVNSANEIFDIISN